MFSRSLLGEECSQTDMASVEVGPAHGALHMLKVLPRRRERRVLSHTMSNVASQYPSTPGVSPCRFLQCSFILSPRTWDSVWLHPAKRQNMRGPDVCLVSLWRLRSPRRLQETAHPRSSQSNFCTWGVGETGVARAIGILLGVLGYPNLAESKDGDDWTVVEDGVVL